MKSNQIFPCMNLKNTPENKATVRELPYRQPKSQKKTPIFKIYSSFEFQSNYSLGFVLFSLNESIICELIFWENRINLLLGVKFGKLNQTKNLKSIEIKLYAQMPR